MSRQATAAPSALAEAIRVSVRSTFLPDKSAPERDHFVWSYHVTIENLGNQRVQLRRRRWLILDNRGRTREVEGVGVLGVEPMLEPGATYEYSSGAPLSTPSGMMHGTYLMESRSGDQFLVAIPAFSLDSPHEAARPN